MSNYNRVRGTRDFTPIQKAKRDYIFNILKKNFELHCFVNIETPAMENNDVLLGKYGEEGDKLLFNILDNGDFLSEIENINNENYHSLSRKISSKSLRYDLTVPFARFVVQNYNELTFPFKRYQIQPVWRADRPQKGRYREFYQCDIDIIGSESLLNELELCIITNKVFMELKINNYKLKINSRKILKAISEIFEIDDKFNQFVIILDKIDKIGIDNVIVQLRNLGMKEDYLQMILEINNNKSINILENLLKNNDIGKFGIQEVNFIFNNIDNMNISNNNIEFDPFLARGLDYYTGIIFEVIIPDSGFGSVCGGGRYDNLTEMFGKKDISGVGISFGAERLYDYLELNNLFENDIDKFVDIMFVNFGESEALISNELSNKLIERNIKSMVYPDITKLKNQLNYADKIKADYVAMIGDNELKNKIVILKDMNSGQQIELGFDDFTNNFKKQ